MALIVSKDYQMTGQADTKLGDIILQTYYYRLSLIM